MLSHHCGPEPHKDLGHERDDLLAHQRLRDHVLGAGQPRQDARQDAVLLLQENDGHCLAQARFALYILQHRKPVHPGQVETQKEQVGGAVPGEKAQRLQRIAEADDAVPLAPQDHHEDRARSR